MSAAPVDDVEFEWSSGNGFRGTINDTEIRFHTKSDEGLNILLQTLLFLLPTTEKPPARNDVKWLAGTSMMMYSRVMRMLFVLLLQWK